MQYFAKSNWSENRIKEKLNRGADGIEIQLLNPETDTFYKDNWKDYVYIKSSKIKVVHFPLVKGYDFPIESIECQKIFNKTIERINEISEILEEKIRVVIHLEETVKTLKKVGLYDNLVLLMQKAADEYDNLIFTIENTGAHNLMQSFSNVIFVKDINRKNVLTCLDTCHAYITQDMLSSITKEKFNDDIDICSVRDFFENNKDLCGLIHLCGAADYGDGFGHGKGHGVAFSGIADPQLNEIYNLYKEYNYKCPCTIEVREDSYEDDTYSYNFEDTLRYAKELEKRKQINK